MVPNLPHTHHYIPCFYTSQWCGEDQRLCVFRKNPYKGVVHRRMAPAATGYLDRLYELRHAPPELAQSIEEELFRPVDTQASEALVAFAAGADPQTLRPRLREAWARFMLSLSLRCPEDIKFLQDHWHAYIAKVSPELEQDYAKDREPGDNRTLADIAASATPAYLEETSMASLRYLISGEEPLRGVLASHWYVFDTSKSRFSLLTSDRPIVRPKSLGRLHMAMPIGPNLLFASFPEPRAFSSLSHLHSERLATECNRLVVEGAAKYVYGLDTEQKPFVSRHFGKVPSLRIMENGMSRALGEAAP